MSFRRRSLTNRNEGMHEARLVNGTPMKYGLKASICRFHLVITTATGIKNVRGHIGIQGGLELLEFRAITLSEI